MATRRSRRKAAVPAPPSPPDPNPEPVLGSSAAPGDISDLKSWLNSRIECLRAESEEIHLGFSKELEAASGRFKKRTKLEMESSSKQMEEANRAWKTFSGDIEEDIQEVQATCKELIAKAQASSSKASCADFLKSVENQIEALHNKYVKA